MPSRRSPSQRTTEGRRGRQLAALSGGSNGGRLVSANRGPSPTATPPAESRQHRLVFSKAGPQDGTMSGPWPLDAVVSLLWIRIACGTPGTTDTVVTVYLDGTPAGALTLPAGDVFAETTLTPVPADPGQLVTVALTTVGTGLETVTVTVGVG